MTLCIIYVQEAKELFLIVYLCRARQEKKRDKLAEEPCRKERERDRGDETREGAC